MMEGLRILVVDDEKYIRELLTELLVVGGHKVEKAQDGEAALQKLAKHPFQVMISDVRMPVMDGLTLLQKAKTEYPDMGVVMMTGFTQQYTIRELVALGADEYLAKPFRQEEVLLMIKRAHQKASGRKRMAGTAIGA